MTTSLSQTLGFLFLMACFGALMNPPPYLLIGANFLLMGLVLLPSTDQLLKQQLNLVLDTKIKSAIIFLGCILIYYLVPQAAS